MEMKIDMDLYFLESKSIDKSKRQFARPGVYICSVYEGAEREELAGSTRPSPQDRDSAFTDQALKNPDFQYPECRSCKLQRSP